MQREVKRLMEGKLRALLRGSLALALVLSMIVLTAPSAGAANGILATYDTPGQFQFAVPAGVTSITVQTWGAGGAGGGSTNAGPFSARGGGGGGGGAYASSTLTVTPGQTIWVVVGAGGTGVSGANGGSGGPSFVGPSTSPNQAHVRAAGGAGGIANTAGGSPSGGAGGAIANSIGQTRMAGDPGEPGGTCFTSCPGGGGRGAYEGGYGGAAPCGPFVTIDGNPGDPAGGGGSGGRTSQRNGQRSGGDGAAGKVVITGPAGVVCATLSPPARQYDLANPLNATTTIIWNDATGIVSIHDGTGFLALGTDYTLVGSTLTILHTPYLAGRLTAAGQSVPLAIDFGICTAVFTVSAIDTSVSVCATISPPTNVYDLDNPDDVTTLITWNDSPHGIASIYDGTANLTPGTHYTVASHDGTATLTIRSVYLASKLTAAGQSVVLTITFEDNCVAIFTITAYDAGVECITISPATGQYDLANPGNVSITITNWGAVPIGSITSIVDNGTTLLLNTHYTLVGNTITILNTYLAGKLTAPGQSVVLTINCDPICAVPFVVMTTGTPAVECASIAPTVRQYDLSNPASQTTTITWNDASSITSIVDNGTTLTPGTHYTVVGNTLTILNAYLAGKLTAAGQSVTLTINFDICSPPTLVISAVDSSVSTCAFISPTQEQYNIAAPGDVTTLITWNDSNYVASIHDGIANLAPGTQFTVHPYNGTARLTIKSAYLESRLTTAGQSVTLTIVFNDGCVATLTIRAIDEPIVVGLIGHPVNKLTVVTPWILFLTALATGTGLLALRRRRSLT